MYDHRSRVKDVPPLNTERRSYVPSRLLRIDYNRKQFQIIDTKGLHYDYATLSYYRGWQDGLPRLTTATYQQLKQGIPYTPVRPLKEVFSILELASLCYIWIDALCVFQDDTTDWEAEASSMTDTYVNSKVTIVHVGSHNASKELESSSRAWVFQHTRFVTRRFVLGNYVLHSHGSDDFSKDWFSRMAKHTILTADETSPAYSLWSFPAISCPHQGCDTFVLRLHGHDGYPFLDLPKELILELEKGLYRNDEPDVDKSKEADATSQNFSETSPNSDLQEKSLPGNNSPEEHYTARLSQADLLIQEGLQAARTGQNLRAVGHLFQAREATSVLKPIPLPFLKIHALTSIYIAAIYLQDGSVDTALRLVEASEVIVAQSEAFDEVVNPT